MFVLIHPGRVMEGGGAQGRAWEGKSPYQVNQQNAVVPDPALQFC